MNVRTACLFPLLLSVLAVPAAAAEHFRVQVVDADTERGVPLVELRTVHEVLYVTDSAGLVALDEPELSGRLVYFYVKSHGYEHPADGFGYRGAALKVTPGASATIKLKRLNVAERLYRVTGAGVYRDSVLLGDKPPAAEPLLNAQVLGQDSVQAAVYQDKVYWFWGDTSRLEYPLGNFRTSGAVSDLPGDGGTDPAKGVDLRYFTRPNGFVKSMCPFEPEEGMIWIDGLAVAPDREGRERLVAHFARMKSLGEMLEHGLAAFDDAKQEFEKRATFKLDERWRSLHGHPLRRREGETDYLYCGLAMPNVRVRADLDSVSDPAAYEAWSCLEETPGEGGQSPFSSAVPSGERGSDATKKGAVPGDPRPMRGADGRLVWRWTRKAPPVGPAEERGLIASGRMKPHEARFQPVDVESGKVVQMHSGSVRYNTWRKRWVLVAVEQGGTSFLGEVWYAEADDPTGPWRRARKIATHDRYSFYNPVHHDFLDRDEGRTIYFEGTYSHTFSGNPAPTPRYDYNQVMYRLDLSDPRLAALRE